VDTTGAFLKRFGASPAEINAVSDWLAGEGFSVTRSAPNFLDFTGPVAQAERTFAVRIAKFGDGSRYANTVDPIVPKRFAGVIGAIRGLDNMVEADTLKLPPPALSQADPVKFTPIEPPLQLAFAQSAAAGEALPEPKPAAAATTGFTPADFYNFYDETAGPGADGSGNCTDIVGNSDFLDSTMSTFTDAFGLPSMNYARVLEGPNPGIDASLDTESELDMQWAHVGAPGASIDFYLGSDLIDDITGAINDNACGAISASHTFYGWRRRSL